MTYSVILLPKEKESFPQQQIHGLRAQTHAVSEHKQIVTSFYTRLTATSPSTLVISCISCITRVGFFSG